MTWYRIIPLALSALITAALFGVVVVLAYQGDHDMRVAVISFITGIGAIPAATSIGKSLGPEQAHPVDPPPVTGDNG